MYAITLLAISLALAYAFLKKKYTYWRRVGVKQEEQNLLFGSLADNVFSRKSTAEIILENYEKFRDERYFGMYQLTKPVLVINDPELIADVTVKNFDHFVDHTNSSREDVDFYWSRAIFALRGKEWHSMRSTLSPAFTGSKMRFMYPLMDEVAKIFVASLLKQDQQIISAEMRDVFSKATNDMITSCVLGIQTDTQKEPENDFYVMAKKTFAFNGIRKLIFFTYNSAPRLTKWLGLKFFPDDFSGFIKDILRQTIKMREDKGIVRPDLVHLLMQARKGKLVDEGEESGGKGATLTEDDMMAQTMIFYFGGYDTSSFLMHLVAYELMVNKEVQEKLRSEIDEAFKKNNDRLAYPDVMKMSYLDMVISETLRKWPIAFFLDRRCVKDYTIEPKRPGESKVHLKDGDFVWIPVIGIHRDPRNYTDPEEFIPERFADENKGNINAFNYMPFGSGPRFCIGSRFALLQTKIIFAHLLHKFELVPVAKSKIPMVIDKTQSLISCEGGMWVGLKRRN